ncbi:UPF0175 family protein [Tautonia rosea]|uniref:UPF0175 family protein n=1 Tax=Tautonia rosea TaxID=2728037 RepID=UPI001474FB9C|nr:UPF0175 family protein [Tautonia rosea]
MTIHFEIPSEIEDQVRSREIDLNEKAREALLVELYREDQITHGQLGRALGLDAYETDGVLKRYGVGLDLTAEELQEEARSLRLARPE